MSVKISRQTYVEMMGPTTGDRVRLGRHGADDRD
jgi:urease alpha subunit